MAERVYEALRNDVKSGFYLPGDRIEASVAAMRLSTSVSPVRAALHRLVGERLVELHAHGGCSVPHLTEIGLREQFEWNQRLVLMAIGWRSGSSGPSAEVKPRAAPTDALRVIEALLGQIGRGTPCADLRRELFNSNIRLHRTRQIEVEMLPELKVEAPGALKAWAEGDVAAVTTFLESKHDRRCRLVPQIIERLHKANASDS